MLDNPISVLSLAEGKEFRLHKAYLVIGLVSTTFFVLAGAVTSIGAILNSDGSFRYPVPTAILFGCFWSGLALLGIWLILVYIRNRLYVSAQIVRSHGVFRTHQVQLNKVIRAKWKSLVQGGGLVLYDQDDKVEVEFGSYDAHEQIAMTQFFRDVLAKELQEDWDRFESYCAPESDTFRQRLHREQRWALLAMPAAGVALFALAIWNPCENDFFPWYSGGMGFIALVINGKGIYNRWHNAANVAADHNVTPS